MTRHTVPPEIELPAALEAAVRAAAAGAPPLPANLGGVQARTRTIRRRRTALRAAAAAGVAVALVASLPALWAKVAPRDPIVGGPVGQPIGLWLNRDRLPVTTGLPSGIHIPGSGGEIAAQLRTVAGRTTVVPVAVQAGQAGPASRTPRPANGSPPSGRRSPTAPTWSSPSRRTTSAPPPW